MFTKQAISFGKETYTRWSDHQAPRLGASVAFYSILSFAPLLVLITAVIAIVFGHESAQAALVNEARQLIGERGADTVSSLLKNAQKPATGTFASLIAFVTLLFGASGVFTELQDALNIMWDAPNQKTSGIKALLKQRLFSFGMVLSVGFLLLVSLLLSAGLAYIGHSFGQLVPLPPFVLESINFVVSFAVIAVLFSLMFKYVPAVHVHWQDVIVGGIGTALLFTIGKLLLGLYLGKASVGSTYGAAGSLVAVVVWIYYSAQIFFFGAEFTRVYADAKGVKPAALAEQPATQATPHKRVKPEEIVGPAGAKRMAESADLPTVSALSAKAASVYSAVRSHDFIPAIPASASPGLLNRDPIRRAELRKLQAKKPGLLVALGLGFVLGQFFKSVRKRRLQASPGPNS